MPSPSAPAERLLRPARRDQLGLLDRRLAPARLQPGQRPLGGEQPLRARRAPILAGQQRELPSAERRQLLGLDDDPAHAAQLAGRADRGTSPAAAPRRASAGAPAGPRCCRPARPAGRSRRRPPGAPTPNPSPCDGEGQGLGVRFRVVARRQAGAVQQPAHPQPTAPEPVVAEADAQPVGQALEQEEQPIQARLDPLQIDQCRAAGAASGAAAKGPSSRPAASALAITPSGPKRCRRAFAGQPAEVGEGPGAEPGDALAGLGRQRQEGRPAAAPERPHPPPGGTIVPAPRSCAKGAGAERRREQRRVPPIRDADPRLVAGPLCSSRTISRASRSSEPYSAGQPGAVQEDGVARQSDSWRTAADASAGSALHSTVGLSSASRSRTGASAWA